MSEQTIKSNELKKPDSFIPSFVKGAQKGLNMVINVIIPNSIFAFMVIYVLTELGIMDILGTVLSPVMGIFGLPGEAAVPLVLAYLSITGGVLGATAMFTTGIITGTQLTIMLPFIFLVGTSIQYVGRILAPSGIASKHFVTCLIISTMNGVLSLFLMRFLLNIL